MSRYGPIPRMHGIFKAQVKDEDLAVMSRIKPDDWVVMLDEHGIDMRSEQLAELIGDAGNTINNPSVHLINPAFIKKEATLQVYLLCGCSAQELISHFCLDSVPP